MSVAAGPAVCLGAVIFAAFGLSFWAPLQYDDVGEILNNPQVVGLWRGFTHWLGSPLLSTKSYVPLPILIDRILYRIAADQPFFYRLTSLLLHWGNAVGVMFLYRRLLGSHSRYFWLALLFALYPAHAEVLAIAAFKKHLLVSFFGLMVLFLQEQRSLAAPWRLGGSWLAMGLALLSKESALVIPLLCLAVDQVRRERVSAHARRDAVFYAGLFAVGLIYTTWRIFFRPPGYSSLAGGNWGNHLLTSGKCLLWYFSQLVLPFKLCQAHSLSAVEAVFSIQSILIAAGIGSVATLGFLAWRLDRILGVAFAWCGVALLPFLNFVPAFNFNLVANRYLYLASVGFFIGLGRVAHRYTGHLRLGARLSLETLIYLLVAIFYLAMGMRNLARYSDPLELWSHAVACAPKNPQAHAALGEIYREQGRYLEAAAEFRQALVLAPGSHVAEPLMGLAAVYAQTGRLGEAIALMEDLARKRPSGLVFNALGAFLLRAGESTKALAALEPAYQLQPGNGDVMMNLSQCYYNLGRLDLAERLWILTLAMPAYRAKAAAYLGGLYAKQGRNRLAIDSFESSLAQDEFQLDAVDALAHLYALEDQEEKGRRLYDRTLAAIESKAASIIIRPQGAALARSLRDTAAKVKLRRSRYAGAR